MSYIKLRYLARAAAAASSSPDKISKAGSKGSRPLRASRFSLLGGTDVALRLAKSSPPAVPARSLLASEDTFSCGKMQPFSRRIYKGPRPSSSISSSGAGSKWSRPLRASRFSLLVGTDGNFRLAKSPPPVVPARSLLAREDTFSCGNMQLFSRRIYKGPRATFPRLQQLHHESGGTYTNGGLPACGVEGAQGLGIYCSIIQVDARSARPLLPSGIVPSSIAAPHLRGRVPTLPSSTDPPPSLGVGAVFGRYMPTRHSLMSYRWWSKLYLIGKLLLVIGIAGYVILSGNESVKYLVARDLGHSVMIDLARNRRHALPPSDPITVRLVQLMDKVGQKALSRDPGYYQELKRKAGLVKWQIVVVQDERPYIYALAGGFLMVHTGVFGYLTNEEEVVAAVLRSVGHVHSQLIVNASVSVWLAIHCLKALGLEDLFHLPIENIFLRFPDSEEEVAVLIGNKVMLDAGYDKPTVEAAYRKVKKLVATYPSFSPKGFKERLFGERSKKGDLGRGGWEYKASGTSIWNSLGDLEIEGSGEPQVQSLLTQMQVRFQSMHADFVSKIDEMRSWTAAVVQSITSLSTEKGVDGVLKSTPEGTKPKEDSS